MKIGILSDVHSNIYGLNAVLNKLKNCDTILCAGDITGYYPFVNEVFEVMEKHDIQFIKGNHDEYLFRKDISGFNAILRESIEYTRKEISPDNLDRLKKAEQHYSSTIDGIKIRMYHGSPWNELEGYIHPDYEDFKRFKEIDAELIILGHTHYPMIKNIGGMLIINPGSCGQPRDPDPRASCTIFNTKSHRANIKRAEYDVNKVCESVIEKGFDHKLVDILKRTLGGNTNNKIKMNFCL